MKPTVIGVAGGSGSGKTTVARHILNEIGEAHVAYLPHDAYYRHRPELSAADRAAVNYDHPDSLETALLVTHIETLLAGRTIARPQYDFVRHLRDGVTLSVASRPLLLVEGILIFADAALRDLMDVRVYVDTDADVRFIRRLRRDMEIRGRTSDQVIDQYLETVRPMHNQFVEPSKRFADIIIPEGGENRVAVDMVIGRLQAMLKQSGS